MELLHEKFKSVKKNMAGIVKRISTETLGDPSIFEIL